MRVRIQRLRHGGIRIREQDLSRYPSIVGNLHMASLNSVKELSLLQPDDASPNGQLAKLIAPELINLGHMRMRFRGIEQITTPDGAAAVVQEWLVELLP